MSKEYVDNLFEKFPDIPDLYRLDESADFKGANEKVVLAALAAEDKKNSLRYVKFHHEASYIMQGSIDAHSDGSKAYIEWAKNHNRCLIACRLNDNAIRDVAMVDLNDMQYLSRRVAKYRKDSVIDTLEPNTEKHAPWAEVFTRKLMKFCEENNFYAPALAKAVNGKTPEETLANYEELLSKWEIAKSRFYMPVKDFVKGGYKLPVAKDIEH